MPEAFRVKTETEEFAPAHFPLGIEDRYLEMGARFDAEAMQDFFRLQRERERSMDLMHQVAHWREAFQFAMIGILGLAVACLWLWIGKR